MHALQRICVCSQRRKIIAKISGKRPERVSIIAGKRGKEIIAPMIFSGYTDSSIFELYIQKFLCPELRKNEVVVCDNASFHKSVKTKNLIENSDCKLMFLPTYSPDLNPIEHFWFAIKHAVRKILPIFWPDINAAIDFVFQKSGKPYFGLLYLLAEISLVFLCENHAFDLDVIL